MSDSQSTTSSKKLYPEKRLLIQGRIISSQPLFNLKVIDKESGQVADVEAEITYRFGSLSREWNSSEKSYQLLVSINNLEDERVPYMIEIPLTIPGADAQINRNYDLNLDEHTRKIQSLKTGDGEQASDQTQTSTTKSRSRR